MFNCVISEYLRISQGLLLMSSEVCASVSQVAAVSGDARRALEICRRATEVAEFERLREGARVKTTRPLVSMRHITTAVQEMFSSPMIVAVR